MKAAALDSVAIGFNEADHELLADLMDLQPEGYTVTFITCHGFKYPRKRGRKGKAWKRYNVQHRAENCTFMPPKTDDPTMLAIQSPGPIIKTRA